MVDSRILCRMRAVHGTYAANTIKYRSAGRLPASCQGSVEFLFWLAASYTLSRFAGLPLKGKQVVTYLTFIFICCRQHFGELAACGGFSPFGAYGTTFPPAKAVGQQPVLCLEQHLKQQSRGALLCSRLRGKGGGASHQRGCAFPSPVRAVVWVSPPAGRFACFPRATARL